MTCDALKSCVIFKLFHQLSFQIMGIPALANSLMCWSRLRRDDAGLNFKPYTLLDRENLIHCFCHQFTLIHCKIGAGLLCQNIIPVRRNSCSENGPLWTPFSQRLRNVTRSPYMGHRYSF